MFRTIKVKLAAAESNLEPILRTALLYTKACQIALNYGFKKKTYNKSKINAGTYDQIRQEMPDLPSALVQCARDQACEMLRREKLRTLSIKKNIQVRYDKRTFSFYPESGCVSLATVDGRLKFPVLIYDYCKRYLTGTYTYTNAQLIVRRGKEVFFNIQCEIEGYATDSNNDILGIDRGILNIVTCSDNSFVNSKHLRNVKGKYQYLKAKLQSLGTRSAKRKLKKLSGRETVRSGYKSCHCKRDSSKQATRYHCCRRIANKQKEKEWKEVQQTTWELELRTAAYIVKVQS
jgi:putative transposase